MPPVNGTSVRYQGITHGRNPFPLGAAPHNDRHRGRDDRSGREDLDSAGGATERITVGNWLVAIVGTVAVVVSLIPFVLASRHDPSGDAQQARERRGLRLMFAMIFLGGLAVIYLSMALAAAFGWSRVTRVAVLVPSLIVLFTSSIVVAVRTKRGPTAGTADRPSGES
jgi:hypothetical protein